MSMTGTRRRLARPRSRPSGDRLAQIRLGVYARDGFRCRHCGWAPPAIPATYDGSYALGATEMTDDGRLIERLLQLDHIHPDSKGGPFSLENLQTLCTPCNLHKGARQEALEYDDGYQLAVDVLGAMASKLRDQTLRDAETDEDGRPRTARKQYIHAASNGVARLGWEHWTYELFLTAALKYIAGDSFDEYVEISGAGRKVPNDGTLLVSVANRSELGRLAYLILGDNGVEVLSPYDELSDEVPF